MNRTGLLPLALLGLVVGLPGCSGNKAVPARLSGKISYNGQSLKAGTLQFHTAEGVVYPGQISTDGTYTATDLPEGELVITVETESLNPAKKAAAGGPGTGKDAEARMKTMTRMQQPAAGAETAQQHYTKIPDKYGNPKTSPLTVTATRGRQVHDIELNP